MQGLGLAQPLPGMAEELEVKKCHLHRKANKACKFCKAYVQWNEQQEKKKEDLKNAALEQLKNSTGAGQILAPTDKAPVPNFSGFPRVLADKIQKTDTYMEVSNSTQLSEVVETLLRCESVDLDIKNKSKMDKQPTGFIIAVYRLLQTQITESDLDWMMKTDSCWIRCAAFLYVRLGFHCDRYWDCVADSLMDDEEFVPFTGKGSDSPAMTVGEYVEQLLMKADYGEGDTKLPLPRIPVAARTKISKRICLYPQFRKRYEANLEVLDRFGDAGVEVEACNVDGEWRSCVTKEPAATHQEHRCLSVLVIYPDGQEEYVSMGRIIVPGGSSTSSDLTTHVGSSAHDLFEKHKEQEKGNAVARGKDYCKPFVQSVCIGGVRFLAGEKRNRPTERDSEALEEEYARSKRHQQALADKLAEKAAIESKYCAKVPSQGSGSVPDRLRLG